MAKFNVEDYDNVEDRLKKFWKDYPNGRIDTKIIHVSEDFKNAIHRCEIYKDVADENPVSTGIAQDQHGTIGANQTSWIENGETSAVGRALANWIYQAKKRPSVTEMQKVENLLESKQVKQETKSVTETSNSNSYTPSPSIQKKIEEAKKLEAEANALPLEQRIANVMETEVTVVPKCMTCGNEVWDNRADKANGKVKDTYPDYKCKTKDCRIWYIDSFAADKKAPEQWYMPTVPVVARDMNDISDDEAPF